MPNREIKVIKAKDVSKCKPEPFDRETLRRQLISMLSQLDKLEKIFCCRKCRRETAE